MRITLDRKKQWHYYATFELGLLHASTVFLPFLSQIVIVEGKGDMSEGGDVENRKGGGGVAAQCSAPYFCISLVSPHELHRMACALAHISADCLVNLQLCLDRP